MSGDPEYVPVRGLPWREVDYLDLGHPTTKLGKALYEEMERLAPGAGDYVEWEKLPPQNRLVYVDAVIRLVEVHGDLLRQALADDDDEIRCAEIAE